MEQVCDFVVAMETCMHCVRKLQDILKQRIDAAVNMRVGPGSDKASCDMISELVAQMIQMKTHMDGYSRVLNLQTTHAL